MTFDPYRKWLSIPEGQRPPTHYQLLGVSPDEQDLEVIKAAVVRQSAFVRNFQSGKHALEAARLLGEIAAAKICLLDPARRAAYDAELRKKGTSPASSPPHENGSSQRSPSASPPAEFQPSASQTLARHPSPAAPASPSSSPPNWTQPPPEWGSAPADWATGELPGDEVDPASTSEVQERVAPGLAFSDTLWNEVSELPTARAPSEKPRMPAWVWGVPAGVLGLIVVVLIVVLCVKSAPPPDSPGGTQGSSPSVRSPSPEEEDPDTGSDADRES